jgi:copper(I)-binding protein
VKSRRLCLLLALLAVACAPSPPPEGVSISGAWVRSAPPGAGMTAGYLTVANPTTRDVEIVEIRSDDFESIELHVTVTEDGMARMRRESSVVVPAGESVDFTPGGRHLMLFGAKRPLAEGDSVNLVVVLADGAELESVAPVTRGDPGHHEH